MAKLFEEDLDPKVNLWVCASFERSGYIECPLAIESRHYKPGKEDAGKWTWTGQRWSPQERCAVFGIRAYFPEYDDGSFTESLVHMKPGGGIRFKYSVEYLHESSFEQEEV